MNIVKTGSMLRIFGDDLKVDKKLAPGTYVVRFHQMAGFYLEEHDALESKEEKIYGVHLTKVNKVLNRFENTNRNLGAILSGDKGMGKSLFSRLLSQEAINRGIPVIIVEGFIPGIHSFIDELKQEVLVLFDEFEKTFPQTRNGEDTGVQDTMLSLFDGISAGKKLFIITCNNFHNLNEFLINRPGRFHFHFRFDYPKAEEVRTYLQDKLNPNYYSEINKVVLFASKVDLNYDCLRAIAYEINQGETFEDAISDLNILNLNSQQYTVSLHFDNGLVLKSNKDRIDMFGGHEHSTWFKSEAGSYSGIRAHYTPKDAILDPSVGVSFIPAPDFRLVFDDLDEDDDGFKHLEKYKSLTPTLITFEQAAKARFHYDI